MASSNNSLIETIVGGDGFMGPYLCSFQNYSSGTDFAADT